MPVLNRLALVHPVRSGGPLERRRLLFAIACTLLPTTSKVMASIEAPGIAGVRIAWAVGLRSTYYFPAVWMMRLPAWSGGAASCPVAMKREVSPVFRHRRPSPRTRSAGLPLVDRGATQRTGLLADRSRAGPACLDLPAPSE